MTRRTSTGQRRRLRRYRGLRSSPPEPTPRQQSREDMAKSPFPRRRIRSGGSPSSVFTPGNLGGAVEPREAHDCASQRGASTPPACGEPRGPRTPNPDADPSPFPRNARHRAPSCAVVRHRAPEPQAEALEGQLGRRLSDAEVGFDRDRAALTRKLEDERFASQEKLREVRSVGISWPCCAGRAIPARRASGEPAPRPWRSGDRGLPEAGPTSGRILIFQRGTWFPLSISEEAPNQRANARAVGVTLTEPPPLPVPLRLASPTSPQQDRSRMIIHLVGDGARWSL